MENGKERRMEGPSGTRRAVPSGTGKGLPLHLEGGVDSERCRGQVLAEEEKAAGQEGRVPRGLRGSTRETQRVTQLAQAHS